MTTATTIRYNAHLADLGTEGTAIRLADGTIQFLSDEGVTSIHSANEVVLCGAIGMDTPTPTPAPLTFPEAPASANVFVELPGIGRVQLTARGTNGAQVVADLLAMVDVAQQAAAQRHQAHLAAQLDIERHRAYTATKSAWIAKAEAKGASCQARVTKAFALVESGAMVQSQTIDGVWQVRSQTSDQVYIVDGTSCTCVDGVQHPERACKHRLAVEIMQRTHTI